MDTKVCTKCGREKSRTEFRKGGSSKHGLSARCKNCLVEDEAARKLAAPSVAEQRNYRRLAARHGLTADEFTELSARPCDICGSTPVKGREQSNGPYHRRSDGKVTGVICRKCVSGLGFFEHDPERLRRALDLL